MRLHFFVAAIALFALGFLAGCPSTPPPPSGTTGSGGGAAGASQDQQCADSLKNAFNSLKPDRLEIDADIEATANELNNWLTSCGTTEWPDDDVVRKLEQILNETQLNAVQAERFGRRDVGHIRTSILMRQIAEQAAEGANSDLEKVLQLFRYVVRNVIQQPDNQKIPLTLYQVMLFGRASAEHQAWAFAELLHQLRIDAAILKGQSGTENNWVVVTCLDSGNYLFDFSLLTPVPSLVSPSWPITKPARLQEVLENPELLITIRSQGSTVPTADQLRSPQVLIPSSVPFWSMRMRSLGQTQSGLAAVLADPLLDGDYGEGVLTRLNNASDVWKRSDIEPWGFPEEQESEYWSIRPNTSEEQALIARMMPFMAPLEVEVNREKQEVNITQEGKKQWLARLAQLRGDFAYAVTTFGGLRIGSKNTRNLMAAQGLDQSFQVILQREDAAAEDAHFWVGTSQYALGERTNARSTYRDYLKRYETARWTDAVHFMLARIALDMGEPKDARRHLEQILKTSSLKKAADFLRSIITTEESTAENSARPAENKEANAE